MPGMEEYIEGNRLVWDELVPLHFASDFYDVASFRAGRSTPHDIEQQEVGDVRGKTLLHLQCHFGMDSLSWARQGASVTGADFSRPAIETARGLASELGIEARFIESDIYRLPEVLDGAFDIVFASYGVQCWLPDFAAWAKVAAGYVKPGGFFYMVEGHPLSGALADDADTGALRFQYPYLASGKPLVFNDDGSYAVPEAKLEHRTTYEFVHGLGETVTALIDAGLRVDFLHEWPFAGWRRLPSMVKGDDGYYRLPDGREDFPFMFSLKATKPE